MDPAHASSWLKFPAPRRSSVVTRRLAPPLSGAARRRFRAAVFATDADGSEPELICAAEDFVRVRGGGAAVHLSRQTAVASHTSSPKDGGTERSTVAIMDLSTRQVTKFEFDPDPDVRPCDSAASDGLRFRNGAPSWSPDGTRWYSTGMASARQCALARAVRERLRGELRRQRAVQLTSAEMVAFDPSWSPDGTRIAFSGDERKPSTRLWATDLYTIGQTAPACDA